MFYQSLLVMAACATTALGYQPQFSGPNFDFPNAPSPKRFNINVNPKFIDFTLRKVRDYRPIKSFFPEWTIEGVPDKAVQDLAGHWANKYNWKAIEKRLNRQFNHYATTVPGNGNYVAPIPLHFVHERSENTSATPLLLIHGWGSSFLEWEHVIDNLTQQAEESFHVVAVDLPGFGFSPAPTQPGLGPKEIAVAFDALMQQLGYDRYGLVSTDIGWLVGMQQLGYAKERIIGHFTDFVAVPVGSSDLERQARNETTVEENEYIGSSNEWWGKHAAYATAQTQKPGALSLAMADSPVGLAGWLWDLKYSSSDGYEYTEEQLISDVMMVWIQGPYGGIHAYSTLVGAGFDFPTTEVPTGVAQFGQENGPFSELSRFPLAPRTWVERIANVTYFQRHDFGGHWPAVTIPTVWSEEVRTFFSSL